MEQLCCQVALNDLFIWIWVWIDVSSDLSHFFKQLYTEMNVHRWVSGASCWTQTSPSSRCRKVANWWLMTSWGRWELQDITCLRLRACRLVNVLKKALIFAFFRRELLPWHVSRRITVLLPNLNTQEQVV